MYKRDISGARGVVGIDCSENWENLANAVVVKAADDYRYQKKLLNRYNRLARSGAVGKSEDDVRREIAGVRSTIATLRRFFKSSPWFMLLSNVSGEYILQMLDRELRGEEP